MGKKGILLVNLGTPDTPTYGGLRRYLNQFLTDRRVIDLPALFRHFLFRCIVVPIRSRRVSKLYQRLWLAEGSPLKVYGNSVVSGVAQQLGPDYHVELAMRYQNPSIPDAIARLIQANVREITIFPLFPQYASTTTGSIFEKVMDVLQSREQIPSLHFVNSYYDHPELISIYADNAREFALEEYDHFIFSFHGVPKRYLKKENNYCKADGICCKKMYAENQFCYTAQCNATANAIINNLQLENKKCTIAYQSRFGPEAWIQPYTDEVLDMQLEKGNKKILVFSPAFVADCLETTIEIGYEYKEEFLEKGGEKLDLVPSLNDDPRWVTLIVNLLRS